MPVASSAQIAAPLVLADKELKMTEKQTIKSKTLQPVELSKLEAKCPRAKAYNDALRAQGISVEVIQFVHPEVSDNSSNKESQ
jgi:hypothetical protein